jgi:hypothetical protein
VKSDSLSVAPTALVIHMHILMNEGLLYYLDHLSQIAIIVSPFVAFVTAKWTSHIMKSLEALRSLLIVTFTGNYIFTMSS